MIVKEAMKQGGCCRDAGEKMLRACADELCDLMASGNVNMDSIANVASFWRSVADGVEPRLVSEEPS
jgi:hypothetical protein